MFFSFSLDEMYYLKIERVLWSLPIGAAKRKNKKELDYPIFKSMARTFFLSVSLSFCSPFIILMIDRDFLIRTIQHIATPTRHLEYEITS